MADDLQGFERIPAAEMQGFERIQGAPKSSPVGSNLGVPDPGAVIAPAVNMLVADPIRNAAADVVALARAGLPTNPEARQQFWNARQRSLDESSRYARLPETPAAQTVERVIGAPFSWLGQGAHWLGEKALGGMGVQQVGPYAQMGLDVLPFAGARMAGPTVASKLAAERGATPASEIVQALRDNNAAGAERYIEDKYRSAIRPTVAGKGTARQINQADQDVVSALGSITRNKNALVLADRSNREVAGRLPQTLDEFVQAIEQTKRPVFAKYDSMARQAEDAGATINTGGAVQELRTFAADPALNLPRFDGVRAYAKETADRLATEGALPPTVAQQRIKNLNEGLTAFYRASSPKAAAEAAVDDLVANHLRRSLDGTLEQMGIPGYLEARREYGALKSIEGEVAHRAIIYGRRDTAGGVIGRLGSIATGEELVRFMLTGDPTAAASAAAIRGTRSLVEYLHSPNRAVKKMFEKMEQLQREQPETPSAAPYVQRGMQPPRPTDMSGVVKKPHPGTPPPPGGTTTPTTLPPAQPPQRPRNPDFDNFGLDY